MIEFRDALGDDASDMAGVQNAIHRAGLRAAPVTVEQMRERYLVQERRLACTVAVRDGRVIGCRALRRAWPGESFGVPVGWGITGTHIHPDAGRGGAAPPRCQRRSRLRGPGRR